MKKVTLLLLFLTTFIACEKEETPKDPPPTTPDSVNINLNIDKIGFTTVSLMGELEYTGTPPKEIGVVYSQNDEEEEQTIKIPIDGNNFSTTLSGLNNNTSYDLKAYAKQNDKTFYSAARTIKTESGIFEGSVELNTQDEIEDFGENGYLEITGKLTINENSSQEITSLEPLNTLIKVSSLTIANLTTLKTLSGLHNLQSSGAIHIDKTSELESIEALSGVSTDLMFLYVHQNESLRTLKGLENISFAQQVEIMYNPLLNNLQGAEGLLEVHDLKIQNNGLTSLKGLRIQKAQELLLIDNRELTSISALSSLENLDILIVNENPILPSLTGLENLQSIDGYFYIFNNTSLTNLDPFINLKKGNLGTALIDSNLNLSDFCGAQHLFLAIGEGNYSIDRNKFNPTYEDFKNDNCKLK